MTSTPIPEQSYGPYEIIHALGRGAMGTVYLARDRRIGRRVALKVIHLAPNQFDDSTAADEFYRRLQREAEVCGSLLHPNIATLYEAGYEDGRVSYLAMEYVEGETLLELLRRSGTVTVETALAIAADVLRGLDYAHGKGIVHRDIKPANVLIAADGVAKIADFGIARPMNSSLTRAGSMLGTPSYMSPEQVLGYDLTPRADIFSLGVTLFEVLTGAKPFAGSDLTGTLHNILRQPAPRVSDVNPAVPCTVGDFVGRLLVKEYEPRPTAAEALAEVERLKFGDRGTTLKAAAWSPHSRLRLRVPTGRLAWGAGTIVLALIGIITFAYRPPEKPQGISPDQLREFDAKRHALAEAKSLFDSGKYQESIARYDAYLQKYPSSVTAQEGRDRARQALERARRRSKRDEDISPAELLRRLKRAILGK
jgi:serine/threonine-protein kinase